MCTAVDCSDFNTEWIHRAQDGDRGAYSELIRFFWKGVVGMIYRLYGDRHFAEDVAQDTFMRVWQRLPSFRLIHPASSLGASFRNWLYRIAVNLATDLIRRDRTTDDIDLINPASRETSLENRIIQKETIQAIQNAVLGLPLASRSVLILREYEGLSYKDISEILNIPLGTVMSRLSYARKILVEKLGGEKEGI
jgi:RNA polymerase sigma-70 factor (ECF subfamily)